MAVKHYNGADPRNWRAGAAVATDSTLAYRRAHRLAAGKVDLDCRFAKASVAHDCIRSDGSDIQPGMTCWYEAAAQLREQANVPIEAEVVVATEAHPIPGLPVYRLIEPGQMTP